MLFSSDWSDVVVLGTLGPLGGVTERVLTRDVSVTPGAAFDGVVTYWRGRFGFRAHAAFSNSCISVGTSCPGLPPGVGPSGPVSLLELGNGSVDLDTWVYDVGGAIGFLEYDPGRWIWPYAFFGIGGITYDLDRTLTSPVVAQAGNGNIGGVTAPVVVIDDDASTEFLLSVQEVGLETSLALNIGIGTDIRIPVGSAGLGLRLEVSDHISESPLNVRLTPLDVGLGGQLPERRLDVGVVHNFRFSAGLVLHFGL